MICGIYKYTSPSNKCYIGQSVNINQRINEHKNFKKYKNPKFYNAIRKYGWNNFKFEIVEQCKPEELNNREIYWISFYDSFNNGYNCTTGGLSNYKRSEETKEKLRKIFTGVYNGDQNIEFYIDSILYTSIGQASKSLNIPPKTIHNRLNSKNIKYDNYKYKDISLIPPRKERINQNRKKCFVLGKHFPSASQAAKFYNFPLASLCRKLKSKLPDYHYC